MFLKLNKIFKANYDFYIFKLLDFHCIGILPNNCRWNHNKVENNLKYYSINALEEVKFDNMPDSMKWNEVISDVLKAKEREKPIPSFINEIDIKELLEAESQSQRIKYLSYLFRKEMRRIFAAKKKLSKIKEKENEISNIKINNHIQYGLHNNTLMLAFRKSSFKRFYNTRLANSILFGQRIVFDLSYDPYMLKKEIRNCAGQLRLVHSVNRRLSDPYYLNFCNVDPGSICLQFFQQEIPHLEESFVNVTEQSYLDLFPKDNLVYLSPHATETLKEYDPKAVYIIGAFVDSSKNVPISIKKAEEEGIKSYALPLKEYVMWGLGSKNLTINQVFEIMLTLRRTGNWIDALSHIPTRKLKRLDSESAQDLDNKIYCLQKN